MTFRRIVVGHDLGDGGRDALALGAALAAATGAELMVTKVFSLELVPHDADAEWRRHEAEQLSALISEAGVGGATPDVIASTSHGRGLYEFVEEADADLIVIGSSSRGALERAVVGDVAMVLLQGAPCAVAVAPRGYRDRGSALRRITVGYDGSTEARQALRGCFELASSARAAVSIVSVVPPVAAVQERAHDWLDEAKREAPEGMEVEGSVTDGEPATVLLDAGAKSDLLVVGSRGYGPVKRVLLGSVSAELVRSARVPVLVFPRGMGEIREPASSPAARRGRRTAG